MKLTKEEVVQMMRDAIDLMNELETDKKTQTQAVYAWLGYWRDKMDPKSVTQLQDILGKLE